jgi:hypothetical protein
MGAIYIKPLASRSPLTFQESSESFEEGMNVEREILEVLQGVATTRGGLEETMRNLQ